MKPAAVRGRRLTDQERAERKITELDFQRLLVGKGGLAPMLGWEHVHIRPGLRANGQWRTSTSGSMAYWPDLVLVRVRDRRLIFAELKRELETPRPEQERVLGVLAGLSLAGLEAPVTRTVDGVLFPSVEVYVWRPSDLRDPVQDSVIGQALR